MGRRPFGDGCKLSACSGGRGSNPGLPECHACTLNTQPPPPHDSVTSYFTSQRLINSPQCSVNLSSTPSVPPSIPCTCPSPSYLPITPRRLIAHKPLSPPPVFLSTSLLTPSVPLPPFPPFLQPLRRLPLTPFQLYQSICQPFPHTPHNLRASSASLFLPLHNLASPLSGPSLPSLQQPVKCPVAENTQQDRQGGG